MADDFCPTRELTQTLHFFPFFRKLFFYNNASYFTLIILQVPTDGIEQLEHEIDLKNNNSEEELGFLKREIVSFFFFYVFFQTCLLFFVIV